LKTRGVKADVAAGLSLGEYCALVAAGSMNFVDAAKAVRKRGIFMQEEVPAGEGGMAAILGMDAAEIDKNIEEFDKVQVANYNCPGQIVISGDEAPVDRAIELLMEAGARRCIPLNVSGPFHTSLMKPAGDKLKERFKEEVFHDMQFPVVFNTLGRAKNQDETIPVLLERQVQSSIYIEDSIRYMAEQRIDTIVEIGPGTALSKFVKKTCPEITCYSVEKAEDVDKLLESLK